MEPPKRPHILYVEDNQDCCQMMSILLDISGIDVTCAHGIAEAVAFPDKYKFDLFLIDLWLKDGSGNDLCKKLRTDFPGTPVVFYTGSATASDRKQGMLSGAAAYLVKPYSELVAPMVFRLVREESSAKVLEPQVHAMRTSDERVKPIPIFTSSDRPLPLSP